MLLRISGSMCVAVLSLGAADRAVNPTFIRRSLSAAIVKPSDLTAPGCRFKPLFGAGDTETAVVRGVARFGEATVDAGGALDDSVAAGPGARVGTFIGEARDRWHGHLYGSVIGFVLGDTDTTVRIALDQRLTVTPRTSILVGVAYDRSYDRDLPGAGLHWQLYF